jgi:hypothetical protein
MLFVYPIDHGFKVGDDVFDLSAIVNDWTDKAGTVIEVDGSNVKVAYPSGNQRWKMHINLRHDDATIHVSACPATASCTKAILPSSSAAMRTASG